MTMRADDNGIDYLFVSLFVIRRDRRVVLHMCEVQLFRRSSCTAPAHILAHAFDAV